MPNYILNGQTLNRIKWFMGRITQRTLIGGGWISLAQESELNAQTIKNIVTDKWRKSSYVENPGREKLQGLAQFGNRSLENHDVAVMDTNIRVTDYPIYGNQKEECAFIIYCKGGLRPSSVRVTLQCPLLTERSDEIL